MKILTGFVGAALAAVLSCTTANAQVLGGNVAGGAGGTLSGGMRDTGVLTRGDGSLSADVGSRIDSRGVRRATRDTAGRTTDRVRDTAGATRNRAESTVGAARDQVRDKSTSLSTEAAATATQATDARQRVTEQSPVKASQAVDGSASGNASASKEEGVSAQSSATAEGRGSAQVSKAKAATRR